MSAENNVPAIRFKGFSGEWRDNKLHQVVDVKSGRDYKHLSIGNIPVFGTGGYMLSVNEALSYDEDAIGIGRKGTIDKPYVLKAPFWTVDTLFYAVPYTKNNLNFVYAIFQKINWRQKDESTGVPSLSKVAINNISVFTTGETEQTKIGNYFQQLDTLIEQHQQKHNKLLNLKKALLEKMFPKQGATVPEIRFKKFSGKWEEKKLDKLLKLGSSKRVHREDYVSSGVPFFRGLEISKLGKFTKLDGILYISKESYIQLKESFGVPQVGDILITAVGTLGNSFLVTNTKPFYFKDGNLIWLSEIKINNEYLNIYIGNGVGRQRILNSAAGSNQKALTMVNLKNVLVIFPCGKEQTKIGNLFKQLDTLITQHQAQLKKLNNIKQACLEKMFV